MFGFCPIDGMAGEDINKFVLHFVDSVEASAMLSTPDKNTDNWGRFDIEARVGRKGATRSEMMDMLKRCTRDFTEADKDSLFKAFSIFDDSLSSKGLKLPLPKEFTLVKTTMEEEGGAAAYTRGNIICVSEDALKKTPADRLAWLVAHETFHVLTRDNPDFRRAMYSVIGFTVLDKEISFSKDVTDRRISNPDVNRYDSYAMLTVDGVKSPYTMVIYSDSDYDGGSFFKYIKLYEMNLSLTSSLIITTYNQKERLALVLDSVKELSYLPNEVLIADDGSKEDTKELIKAYQKDFPVPLKHIWQEDKGFRLSEIRNLAIKNAKCEYIIIIDGDMILDKNFIKDHLSFAKKKVFLQASRTIIDEKDSQKILRDNAYKLAFDIKNFKKYRILALAKLIYLTSRIRANFFDKNDFIRGIRGCNMSFFKKDCEDINGFNEDFIGWGREDSEFVARFLFNKGELRRLKFSAIAYHIYHKENSRTMLDANHKIYLECVKNKNTFCKNGLEKF